MHPILFHPPTPCWGCQRDSRPAPERPLLLEAQRRSIRPAEIDAPVQLPALRRSSRTASAPAGCRWRCPRPAPAPIGGARRLAASCTAERCLACGDPPHPPPAPCGWRQAGERTGCPVWPSRVRGGTHPGGALRPSPPIPPGTSPAFPPAAPAGCTCPWSGRREMSIP